MAVLGLKNRLIFVAITIIACILPQSALENLLYDTKMQLRQTHYQLQSPIVIVDIDEKSLQQIGGWPWDRRKLTELLSAIHQHDASIIGLNLLLPQNSDAENDLALANYIHNNLVVPSIALDFNNNHATGQLPAGIKHLNDTALTAKGWLGLYPTLSRQTIIAGHLNAPLDDDGKIRRVPNLIMADDELFSPLSLTMLYQALDGNSNIESWLSYAIKIIDEDEILIPYDFALDELPVISATELLTNQIKTDILSGSMVLIGSSSAGLDGLISTPVQNQMPGVAIHAYLLNAALANQWITTRKRDLEINILSIVIWSLFVLTIWHLLALRWLVAVFITALVSIISISFYNFIYLGIYSELSQWIIVVGVQLLWVLFVSYRQQIKQNRKIQSLFKSYVPDNIMLQLLEDDIEAFEKGERKEVTVLFADLIGFTKAAESMEPAELTKMTREIFNELTEVVLKHKGTVDKYMGDSIMAFWGAPLEDRKHAENAVKAASEMVDRIRHMPYGFDIGIGVNSGEVIVGNMGSNFRHAYSVMGDPVNVAARLESKTRDYDRAILIGHETAKQIRQSTCWLAETKLKGKQQCIDIYTLC